MSSFRTARSTFALASRARFASSVLSTSRVTLFESPLHRSFSSTPRVRALERNDDFANVVKSSPTFAKIASNPELLESIKDLAVIMQRHGFSTTEKPSLLTMGKLMMNTEVKEAVADLAKKFEAAGIEVNASTAMEMMKALGK